jgi:DNA modification methylase
MAQAAAEQFDVILTDPPYGMGADEFGDSGGRAVGAHEYADDAELWKRVCKELPWAALRLTKPQAHFYAFCDIDGFPDLRAAMRVAGWWVHRTPIVWHKPSASRVPWPEHGPQRKYELVLYAVKGNKPVTRIFPDLVSYNTDDNLGYGAQKPVAMYVDLLKRSVQPGNRVLDPFAGTGTIFPAAHEMKCIAVGIEQQATAYGICLKRLEALKAQGELPV